jgi:hypothetical protein
VRIELEGLKVELQVGAEAGWEILRFAASKTAAVRADELLPPPLRSNGGNSRRQKGGGKAATSKAARIREIARDILADGKPHEQREIGRAVREAGLRSQHVTGALEAEPNIERFVNGLQRPAYRDRSVAPPDRNRRPLEASRPPGPAAETIEIVGRLGANGGGSA